MKIAAPSRDGQIDQHFGHCKEYLVFKVVDQKLVSEETLASTEGCGCKSNIASVLAAQGVTHMVAGNRGDGAVNVLQSHGISVIRGATGDTRAAVEAFAAGKFADTGIRCAGHEGHECNHN